MIEITQELLQYAVIAVGGGGLTWAMWPGVQWGWSKLQGLKGSASDPVSYETAMHYLAMVRSRVKWTGLLADEQRRAVDVLTLALNDGFDGPEVSPDVEK